MAAQRDILLSNGAGSVFGIDNWAPAAVTGAAKVAQRFVYFLVTPAGSIPGYPTGGTNFVAAVRTFRSEFDLFAAFSAAAPAAARSVVDCQEATDPASDRYGTARLSAVTVSGDSVAFTLAVTAADGSAPPAPTTFVLEP